MLFLTPKEACHWLRERGHTPDLNRDWPSVPKAWKRSFLIPKDSLRKAHLAWLIARFMLESKPALLWTIETDIWSGVPALELLFDGYRSHLGAVQGFLDAPVCVASPDEMDAFAGLIGLSMFACWGGVLIQPTEGLLLTFNHDEFLDSFAGQDERLKQLYQELERFGMSGGG